MADYSFPALARAAGIDPWALALQVTGSRPDVVRDVGRYFGARAAQAAETARPSDTADLSTERAYLQDGVPVHDAAASRRQTRHGLSEGGDRFVDTGSVFHTVADGLTAAAVAARTHMQTIDDDVYVVIAQRNRFFAEYGSTLPAADVDAAEQRFHGDAVRAVRAGAARIQTALDGFSDILRSRTARLAELTDAPAPATPNPGGSSSDPWGAAAGAVIDGAASLGNAIAHNPSRPSPSSAAARSPR